MRCCGQKTKFKMIRSVFDASFVLFFALKGLKSESCSENQGKRGSSSAPGPVDIYIEAKEDFFSDTEPTERTSTRLTRAVLALVHTQSVYRIPPKDLSRWGRRRPGESELNHRMSRHSPRDGDLKHEGRRLNGKRTKDPEDQVRHGDMTRGGRLNSRGSLEPEDFYLISQVVAARGLGAAAADWERWGDQAVSWSEGPDDMVKGDQRTGKAGHSDSVRSSLTDEGRVLATIKRSNLEGDSEASVDSEDDLPNETEEGGKSDFDLYSALCRGPGVTPPGLSCTHQPLRSGYGYWKRELVSTNPTVILYHDVITDADVKVILETSTDDMESSQVMDDQGGALEATYRISYSTWLEEPRSLLWRLEQRIHDMTGLEVGVREANSDAEYLQVCSYPPGGLYQPHFDTLSNQTNIPEYIVDSGDRVATFMLYLNTVDTGGATVFPALKLRVAPSKGSALFWYNLHADGSLDSRALHAGCPVIFGNKWVANKWIHERGQMFNRPCPSKSLKLSGCNKNFLRSQ